MKGGRKQWKEGVSGGGREGGNDGGRERWREGGTEEGNSKILQRVYAVAKCMHRLAS